MEQDYALFQSMVDHMDEGLLYVDAGERIRLFNQRAKEITGVVLNETMSHPGGRLEPGDVVVIADNCLGGDDGDLTPEDLALLGIRDTALRAGDMLLAVGVYGQGGPAPVYKYARGRQPGGEFTLDTLFQGVRFRAAIRLEEHVVTIEAGGVDHPIGFFETMGHMVVLDGRTGAVKFFQAKGYTIRRETVNALLHGGAYRPKDAAGENISVLGRHLEEIFEGSRFTRDLEVLLKGGRGPIEGEYYHINKRSALCSLYPVPGPEAPQGVLVRIRDLSELEKLLDDRNRILEDVERKSRTFDRLRADLPEGAFQGYVGSSPAMNEVKYLAYRASQTKFNVILTGESGTGKSQLAREIHDLHDPAAPFVEVNCNAIAPTLIESELFGYVGGAFTGAAASGRAGYFEDANGGTIFLDEIGDLPQEIQVKLLYVLQRKTIYRVGSSKPIAVDVRVITATNKDLEEEVRAGRFRQDLYYRIHVFPIRIPPLRERRSDIYLLIDRVLKRLCQSYGVPPKQLSGEAMAKMLSYPWPGNVRELENVLERAITLCDSGLIFAEHVDLPAGRPRGLKEQVEQAERDILEQTLRAFQGDKALAIRELGVSRSVFYEKLKRYGIEG